MSINNVNVTGRITNDIELRRTNNSGKAVINFTIAVNSYFKEEPEWVDCVIWGKLAENLATYCGKGSLIGITGRLQTSSYENQDGRRIKTTEVVVERLEFLGSSNRQQNYNQNYQGNQNSQYNRNNQNYQNNGNNRNVRGYQHNNSNYSNNSNNYNGQNMQTYVPNNQNYQNVQNASADLNTQVNQSFQNDNLNYDDNSFDLDNYDMLEDDIQF